MKLEMEGVEIEFEEDSIHSGPAPGSQHNADARQAAVEQWKKGAQRSTLGQLNQAVNAVQALVVQLRAVGGSAASTDLGKRMRLAADFLEDL